MYMSDAHTLRDLLDAYRRDILPDKAPRTQYQQNLIFKRLLNKMGDKLLTDITPALLRAWRDQMREAGYKSGTIRYYLDTLSAALTAAVMDYEWLDTNPMRRVRKPPESPGRVRFLSHTERQQLLNACQASQTAALYPLVILALATGARKTELLTLRWEHMDLERGIVRFMLTKNKTRRVTPLVPVACTVMQTWHAQARRPMVWVFPSEDGQQPCSIRGAWEFAVKRAGIVNFRFHDLRHTAASFLAMSGATPLEIAEILGHKTMRMVQRYSHFSEPHTRSILEKMADQFLPLD